MVIATAPRDFSACKLMTQHSAECKSALQHRPAFSFFFFSFFFLMLSSSGCCSARAEKPVRESFFFFYRKEEERERGSQQGEVRQKEKWWRAGEVGEGRQGKDGRWENGWGGGGGGGGGFLDPIDPIGFQSYIKRAGRTSPFSGPVERRACVALSAELRPSCVQLCARRGVQYSILELTCEEKVSNVLLHQWPFWGRTGGETITCVDFTTLNSKTIGAQVLYIQLLREMHSIFQFHLLNWNRCRSVRTADWLQ